jgi:hypothetical protein
LDGDNGYYDTEYYYEDVPDLPSDAGSSMPITPSDSGSSMPVDSSSGTPTTSNRGLVSTPTPTINVPGATQADQQKAQSILQRVVNGSLTSQDLLTYLKDNPLGAASVLGGLANLNTQPSYNRVGYQGTIPQLTATRAQVPYQYDPNRRPGSGGRQYFTDVQYTAPTAEAANAAQQAARAQARQIAAEAAPTSPMRPVANTFDFGGFAQGGLMALAHGRYLQGDTDGMSDDVAAEIDGREPAKLSHGEFVVPADVVSHLGNGNSDAGAKKLYQMMDKIRMARTGTKEQGKEINADKYIHAAMGGSVGYASGGGIKGYAGTTDGSAVTSSGTAFGTAPGTAGPMQNVYESNLSSWAGPYVTGMLGKGMALAEAPYQAYQGPLTAGASELQKQAFQTASGLQTPTAFGTAINTAGDVTGQMQGLAGASFGTPQAQQYMNPYLQASLNPQLDEARRQAQITNLANMSKLTQAGAYGGGRQAIMQSEADRNLATNLANITGQGYKTAYEQATAQYNADQNRKLAALQGALGGAQAQGSLASQENQTGLANLAQQQALGAVQRGITSEGVAADKAQFEEARDYPYKMVQYAQNLLGGLPLQTQAPVTPVTSAGTNFAQGYTYLENLLKNLNIPITSGSTVTSNV